MWYFKNPEKNLDRHSKSLSKLYHTKTKKNGNFKMGNLTLTEILSAWRDLFWIFVVPYKISNLFDNKNTIWLKIYPCFRSQITTCNLPTWPGTPCIYLVYTTGCLKVKCFFLKLHRSELCGPKCSNSFSLTSKRPSIFEGTLKKRIPRV